MGVPMMARECRRLAPVALAISLVITGWERPPGREWEVVSSGRVVAALTGGHRSIVNACQQMTLPIRGQGPLPPCSTPVPVSPCRA
jgi:hypothetical protein